MTDADAIGYLLDLLDPDDRAAVATQLERDPIAVDRLARIRDALLPLEADRDSPEPPPGLVARTLARVAGVAPQPAAIPAPPRPTRPIAVPEGPDPRRVGGRFRLDWLVAAGVAFLAVGLTLSAVNRLRLQQDAMACQNSLRGLHHGLVGYADTHHGRFPQVGVDYRPPVGNYTSTLAESGQLTSHVGTNCPASPRPTPGSLSGEPARYAYTLGYRTATGELLGYRRSEGDENDLVPIAADCPRPADDPGCGPRSPHVCGQNVLYVGGHVRFATTALVGINGDDVYRNTMGYVAAGRNSTDSVLGRAGDMP